MLDFFRELTKSAGVKRQEALHAYLDNALTPRQRRRFEEELAQDTGLQRELDQLRLFKRQLRQLPRRPVPRNFTLDPALYGRPQGLRQGQQSLARAYPVLRVATALTAFFFVLALAAGLLGPAGAPLAPGIAQISEEASPVDARVVTEMEYAEEPVEEAGAEPPAAALMAESAAETLTTEEEVVAAEALATEAMATEEVEGPPAGDAVTITADALPTALPTPVPPLTELEGLRSAEAAEAPATTLEAPSARDIGEPAVTQAEPVLPGATWPQLWSPLQWLQTGLGLALVVLALVTFLARRRL